MAGLIGALVALPTLRAKGPYLAMVTIAFSVIIYVVAQNWTDLTRGPEGIKNIPGIPWFGTEIRQLRTYRPFGDDGLTIGGAVAYFWVVGVAALLVQVVLPATCCPGAGAARSTPSARARSPLRRSASRCIAGRSGRSP